MTLAIMTLGSVAAMAQTLPDDEGRDSSAQLRQLAERVRALESMVHALQNTKDSAADNPTTMPPAQAENLEVGIVIKVLSFTKACDDPALLAVAAEADARLKSDEALLALANAAEQRLLEQAERYGERSTRADTGSSKSTVNSTGKSTGKRSSTERLLTADEYARAMEENKRQHKKLASEIIELSNKVSNGRRLANAKRRDATSLGQRIVGVADDGAQIVVTTKSDCSRFLVAGVDVRLVNAKSIECDGHSTEFKADRVTMAK